MINFIISIDELLEFLCKNAKDSVEGLEDTIDILRINIKFFGDGAYYTQIPISKTFVDWINAEINANDRAKIEEAVNIAYYRISKEYRNKPISYSIRRNIDILKSVHKLLGGKVYE